MPIEFYCPGCGNLMRTPVETAGRKGRCPTCQLKIQIPGSSVAATSSESAVRRSAVAATPKPNVSESIRFECRNCGKTLSIAAKNAGKQGQCPHCGKQMTIPLKSPVPGERWKGAPKQQQPMPSPARTSTPAPMPQPASTPASSAKIEFHCSNCREVVRIGAAAAGKKGKCPRCQAVIQIPLKSTSVSGLQAIPSNKPTTPRPQSKPVTPPAGLTPLPSNSPAYSGLTPLDDVGLSPLEPLGLTPLEPADAEFAGDFDPLGIDSVGLATFSSADSNPFASGAPMTAARPVRRAARPRSGLHIATMVCASMMIAFAVIQMIWLPLGVAINAATGPDSIQRERMPDDNEMAALAFYSLGKKFAFVLTGCAELIYLTVLAGAIQMLRFKTWGLGLLASILCLSPCGCLCFFGVPLGIWGIVMLSLGPIRQSFS